MNNKKILGGLAALVAIVVMVVLGNSMNSYYMTVINTAIIYFMAVLGIRLVLGMGGQMSFAAVAFMGFGAFITGQLCKTLGVPSLAALILGTIIGAGFSFLFGVILLRMKGPFFIFGTISLVNIMATIFQNFRPLSGGQDGLFRIPKLNIFGFEFSDLHSWFYLLLFFAVLCALIVQRISATSFGRSLMAVRDDDLAAAVLGVDVYFTKLVAFTIAGAMASLGGGLLAFHNGVVSASLFTFDVQLKFLIMAMLGGIQSTLGAALGTLIVQLMPEVLRPLMNYMNLVYGIGIVLLMIFMPMGITGMITTIRKKIRKGSGKGEAAA